MADFSLPDLGLDKSDKIYYIRNMDDLIKQLLNNIPFFHELKLGHNEVDWSANQSIIFRLTATGDERYNNDFINWDSLSGTVVLEGNVENASILQGSIKNLILRGKKETDAFPIIEILALPKMEISLEHIKNEIEFYEKTKDRARISE